MRQGPLAGRYPAAAAMVIFALVPYLGLSAALQPLTPMIGQQLHMSMQTMSLGLGMANAGYAAEAAPTWKGIVNVADEHNSSLIVLGSHGRTGLASVLIGSVAEAVAAHSRRSVLIIHRRDAQDRTAPEHNLETKKDAP